MSHVSDSILAHTTLFTKVAFDPSSFVWHVLYNYTLGTAEVNYTPI